ncbi:hypothetical protein BDV29DRAFT_177006, partial [Aspergillus leporis]
ISRRGAANRRPVSPPDPTLVSNPISRTRSFPVQSFGPGAATDFHPRPLSEIDEAKTNPAVYYGTEFVYPGIPENFTHSCQESRQLFEEVETWEEVSWRNTKKVNCDPTWGSYVFITSYSESSLVKIPQAIKKWICAVERSLKYGNRAVYADEAFKRFKLDVILDESVLANASTDRVREEFRALIRGLDLYDPPEEESGLQDLGESNFMVPPARNKACFVLDEADLSMLANLDFSEDPTKDFPIWENKKLRLINGGWRRPSFSETRYRGIWYCPVMSLPRIYQMVTFDGNVLEGGLDP